MAVLRLGVTVPGPQEEVYAFVTAFGAAGPLDEEQFREKYGEVLERDGDTIVVREDDEVDVADVLTWRCTFDYPQRRVMEVVDSPWADRIDEFRATQGGTRWTVTFRTKRTGFVGFLQWLFFRLLTSRGFRRRIVEPVVAHFRDRGGADAEGA